MKILRHTDGLDAIAFLCGFQVSAPVEALLKMRDTAQDARDATDLQFFARYNALRNPKVNVWTVRFTFPAGLGSACATPPLSWALTAEQSSTGRSREQLRQTQPAIACVMGDLKGLPLQPTIETAGQGGGTICPTAAAADSGGATP